MNALSLIEKIACLPSQEKNQIEWMVDRFLAHSLPRKGCDCHVVDPKKQNMIIWPSKDDLIVKFIDQRLIALPRVDKRGAKYWKVRDFYENEEKDPEIITTSSPVQVQKSFAPEPKPEVNQPLSDSPILTDRLAKFQERQAKAQQLQSQKETKWINGNEVLTQLAQEKATRESQKEETKENANNPNQSTS